MTMTRYRAAACEACGNHTVMTASGVCHTCVCQTYPGPRRRYELSIIYAAGIAIGAAFVLVVLTGHVRADTIISTGSGCFDILGNRTGCPTAPDKVCNIGHMPDGNGGCITQQGSGSSGGLRVQIAPDDRSAALVIRTRDKKSVMIRGLNMGACTATAAELSKSPDVEFAECFR